jgi:hypothetical protein
LFKIVIQGVSLWYFHVYMYYNPNLFISSIFLLSTLVSFLWWFQQVKKFCINSHIGSISTIFTFLTSFFYLPSLICDLPLMRPVFHNIACICIRSIFHIWEKTCGLWPSEPG